MPISRAFGRTLRMRCSQRAGAGAEVDDRRRGAGDDVDRRGGGVDQLAVVRNQRGDQLVVLARLDAEMCGGAHGQIPSEAARSRCQRSMSAALIASPWCKRPVERGDQVVGVFEADREPDQPIEAVALQLVRRA